MTAMAPAAAPGMSFSVTPYIWLPSIRGTFNVPTPYGDTLTSSADVGVGDYIGNLNFAAMLAADARYERFSLLTDFVYVNLSTGAGNSKSRLVKVNIGDRVIPIGADTTASTSMRIAMTEWTLAGGYTVADGTWGNVDVIAGARLVDVWQNTNYTLTASISSPRNTLGLNQSGSVSSSRTIWNGIAGLRGRIVIPDTHFFVPSYFDIGAGDSNLTWQAAGGVGYGLSWADLSLTYRYLTIEQGKSARVQTLSLGGPMLTATFRL